MFESWKKLALDLSMLAWEAPQVVALRLLKLSRGGPAASREAKRMINEKAIASWGRGRSLRRELNGLRRQRLSEESACQPPAINELISRSTCCVQTPRPLSGLGKFIARS